MEVSEPLLKFDDFENVDMQDKKQRGMFQKISIKILYSEVHYCPDSTQSFLAFK